ncbi:MAG: NAD/FAD-utilizing enzyme [Haliea sp.]|uniref:NAD/FAD-utilizing enzyme n=1 Tax=Haliea sp. TaxID=1932666 RepID=UPI0032EDCD2C
MKRHFFLSEDLDDLGQVERDLEAAGVSTPQIHVLSEDDAGVQAHKLNDVEAVLRKDVVHGTERGAVIGVIGAAIVLGAGWATGITDTITWVPVIFLAVIVLGFCTWEGGLIGIQEPHSDFKRFTDDLRNGKHVMFVDVSIAQEDILRRIVSAHPKLTTAGEGPAAPGWFVSTRARIETMMKGTAWRHQ